MSLTHIALALGTLLKLFSLWFLATALLFWRKPPAYPRAAPKTRFACLIPARNEEAVVGALIRSLKQQSYPAELFDVYVIPNNCADGTEAAALAAGAKLLHFAAPVRCKGDVLHQTVARLLPEDYDAFCVFDADNVAHPDFLARMNDAFCAGARVAKARMRTKNPYDSWVTGCYALYFSTFELFFNRSRAALGLSAKLVGTGFAVHRDVLADMGGWNTETIAEDAEFAALCAARGERVFWVSEAVTFDEAPRSFRVSLTQRTRWVSGVMCAAQRRVPDLLRAVPNGGGIRALDSAMFLCAPFVGALGALPTLLLALSDPAGYALALAVGYAGMTLAGMILAFISGYRDRRMAWAALLFPLFMASWLPLQIISLLHRTTDWKEIRHHRAVDVGELLRPRL